MHVLCSMYVPRGAPKSPGFIFLGQINDNFFFAVNFIIHFGSILFQYFLRAFTNRTLLGELEYFFLFNSLFAFSDSCFGKISIFWLSIDDSGFLFNAIAIKILFRTTGTILTFVNPWKICRFGWVLFFFVNSKCTTSYWSVNFSNRWRGGNFWRAWSISCLDRTPWS